MTGDHPRVCGEHMMPAGTSANASGSSPRVRGTLPRRPQAGRIPGIIPACAGNTCRILPRFHRHRDHPRVCGEHVIQKKAGVGLTGSSPRVRGTPEGIAFILRACGIIPACAGNTMSTDLALKNLGDHPRVCGEHISTRFFRTLQSGSSPRVRGTPFMRFCAVNLDGIIPACAGNTTLGFERADHNGDHPRVCGEHCAITLLIASISGSSPRVRGTRIRLCIVG